jgi:hypothetical protein
MSGMLVKATIAAALIRSGPVPFGEVIQAAIKSATEPDQNSPALIALRNVTNAIYKSLLEDPAQPGRGARERDIELG